MNWDDLRYVLCLHTEGTLTRASGRLGVSHTTVARRVRAMESTLGGRLFDKTPQGYVPTVIGEEVLAIARKIEDQFHAVDLHLLGGDARLSGLLRVNTIDWIAFHHAKELGAFCSKYPDVELEVTVDNRASDLSKRESDVGIRMSNSPPEHLVGRKLGRIEWAIYASEELITSLDDPTDIGAYPWLGWREEATGPLTREFLAKHAPNARPAYRINSTQSMLAAVCAGTGAGFLGCAWGDRTEGVRRIRDIEPDYGVDLWMLTHPELRSTARIRAFMDHFSSAMQPYVDLMAGRCPANTTLSPALATGSHE